MRKLVQAMTIALSFWVAPMAVKAQSSASDFPNRPIELSVNFGAGGTTDAVARKLAAGMEKILGQPFVIVNKPGAQATLQAAYLAKQKPDGYTIGLLTFSPIASTPHLMNVPYTLDDFDVIGAIGRTSYGIVVPADSPVKTLDDLVKKSKEPKGVTFGVTGPPNSLAMLQLAKMTGGKFEQITYKSGMEAVTAAVGKHVDVALQNPPDFVSFVKDNKLRMIASAGPVRVADLPDVPTMREQGYDIAVDSYLGVGAPKGVPEDIRSKLEAAVIQVVGSDDFKQFLRSPHGMDATPLNGAEYKQLLVDGKEKMGKLIKELNIPRIN